VFFFFFFQKREYYYGIFSSSFFPFWQKFATKKRCGRVNDFLIKILMLHHWLASKEGFIIK